MTSKRGLAAGLALLGLFLAAAMVAGCARQSPMKSETWVHREAAPATPSPAGDLQEGKAATQPATGRDGLREETLREQRLGEQTLREPGDAGRAVGGAAARADAAGAAMAQGMQIPDLLFDFNEYKLTPENQAILKVYAQAYLQRTGYTLTIEGHCDERGTVEYNLALGQKRADEAAQFLIHLGIAKERIRVISYGKEKPLDPGHDDRAWARNRRVHFVTSPPEK